MRPRWSLMRPSTIQARIQSRLMLTETSHYPRWSLWPIPGSARYARTLLSLTTPTNRRKARKANSSAPLRLAGLLVLFPALHCLAWQGVRWKLGEFKSDTVRIDHRCQQCVRAADARIFDLDSRRSKLCHSCAGVRDFEAEVSETRRAIGRRRRQLQECLSADLDVRQRRFSVGAA